MSWTFSNSDTDLDQVRVLIGDTDTTDQLLTDEIIKSTISSTGGILFAAARCATMIAAKFSRKVTKSIGDKSVQFQELSQNYRLLASDLLQEAKRSASKPSKRIVHESLHKRDYPAAYEHCDAPSGWDEVQERIGNGNVRSWD
jgi:hypothetical protein